MVRKLIIVTLMAFSLCFGGLAHATNGLFKASQPRVVKCNLISNNKVQQKHYTKNDWEPVFKKKITWKHAINHWKHRYFAIHKHRHCRGKHVSKFKLCVPSGNRGDGYADNH